MVNYRRNRVCDGTYFFTVTLKDRQSDLLIRHIDELRTAWKRARDRVPHAIVAVVVLPEHLHALIKMQDGIDNYPRLWQDIKKGFTRAISARSSPWQSRYWEHTIRDDTDLQAHFDYIHFNPVKHGWVAKASDWPHSSFHRYRQAGQLPEDWATDAQMAGPFGEP